MIESVMSILAFADDGVALFNKRNNLISGTKMTCKLMEKWGLNTHVGCEGKNFRIELTSGGMEQSS